MNTLKYLGLVIPPILLAHPYGRRDPLWSLVLAAGGAMLLIFPTQRVMPPFLGALAIAVYCGVCGISQRQIIKQLRVLPLGMAHTLFWYGFITNNPLIAMVGVGVGLLAIIPLDGLLRQVDLNLG